MKPRIINQNSSLTVLARLVNGDTGDPITREEVYALSYTVIDKTTGVATATDVVIDKATCVSTELLRDMRWKEDSIGFNFAYTFNGSLFPDSQHSYAAEVKITTVTGHVSYAQWELLTRDLASVPN